MTGACIAPPRHDPDSRPSDARLLLWVLWKLQGTQPVTITLQDVQACHQAFPPRGPALLIRGPGKSVEVRVTSQGDAQLRRRLDDIFDKGSA
jgi:hypothetical protein